MQLLFLEIINQKLLLFKLWEEDKWLPIYSIYIACTCSPIIIS